MNHFQFNWVTLLADLAIIYSAFKLGWILCKRKYDKVRHDGYDIKAEDKAYKLLVKR
jgi:hypothetical protein